MRSDLLRRGLSGRLGDTWAECSRRAIGLAAGFLLGYSSRLAFGCNVGAMVSGISTGSVHGWVWVPLAFAGTLVGLRVRRRFF